MTNQHGYDGNIAGKRGFELDPYKVISVFKPPLTCGIACICPARTNDDEHRSAVANDAVQMPAKILPERN